jgi:hypothetical protein
MIGATGKYTVHFGGMPFPAARNPKTLKQPPRPGLIEALLRIRIWQHLCGKV